MSNTDEENPDSQKKISNDGKKKTKNDSKKEFKNFDIVTEDNVRSILKQVSPKSRFKQGSSAMVAQLANRLASTLIYASVTSTSVNRVTCMPDDVKNALRNMLPLQPDGFRDYVGGEIDKLLAFYEEFSATTKKSKESADTAQ